MSKPIFGDPDWIARKNALKSLRGGIETMHARYGVTSGKTCGSCVHFVVNGGHARNYFKCNLYGVTNGPGTDWRMKYEACGKWEEQKR